MTSMKTLTIAALAAVTWIWVTAICLTQIASVPANLAAIEARQKAPAPVAQQLISVAQASEGDSAPGAVADSRFGP